MACSAPNGTRPSKKRSTRSAPSSTSARAAETGSAPKSAGTQPASSAKPARPTSPKKPPPPRPTSQPTRRAKRCARSIKSPTSTPKRTCCRSARPAKPASPPAPSSARAAASQRQARSRNSSAPAAASSWPPAPSSAATAAPRKAPELPRALAAPPRSRTTRASPPAHHAVRRLVLAHTDEPRVSQLVVPGPLHERDLHDDLRPHPVPRTPRQSRPARERTRFLRECIEPRAPRDQLRRIAPGAALAGHHEVGAVVVPDEQRAQSLPLATRIRKTADDELLRRLDLHLQPRGRTPRLVHRPAALRDHALPALARSTLPRLV